MRRFGIMMSSIIIMISVLFLSISFSIKDKLISNISTDEIDNIVTNEIISLTEKNLDNLTNEEKDLLKEEIKDNKEVNKIVDKYLKSALNDISNDKEEYNVPNVKKEITKVTDSCLGVLESSRGKEIPNEIKDSIKTKFTDDENINNIYKNSIDLLKSEDNSTISEIISLYNFITNQNVKIGFCFTAVLFILLMLILSKPKYSFSFNLGITMLIPGFGMLFGLIPLLEKMLKSFEDKIDISDFITKLSDTCHYLILVSIILICLYFVIKLIFKNKKD